LAVPDQDPLINRIQERESHNSAASTDSNAYSREDGEINFDALVKRCEGDEDLVASVLEAFSQQGTASCTALGLAYSMKDQRQLLIQAV
jgi:hypothetical protein